MASKNFLNSGIAAITLAILFPIYWITVLNHAPADFDSAYRNDIQTLTGLDALFLLIGGLEIYIYCSLRDSLKDMINTNTIRVLLMVLMAIVAMFHSTVIIDFIFAVAPTFAQNNKELLIGLSQFVAIGMLIIYALVGIVFAGLIIFKKVIESSLLKSFAVLMLIMCLFQLTIILALVNILIFPIALIVLAVYFLKEPNLVEVV